MGSHRTIRSTLLSLALSAATCQGFLAAQAPRVETLPNGLRVVLLEDHAAPRAVAAIWIHVGSKDEQEKVSGFSHALEHLIPQGTRGKSPLLQQLELFRSGGIFRNRADYDHTFFFAESAAPFLDRALEGLFEQVTRATLSEVAIARIGPGLLREVRGIYSDPGQVVFLEQMRAAFPGQPYRFPPPGSPKNLESLDHTTADAFYSNFYVPNNMVVAVGGDINPSKVLDRIRALADPLKRSRTLPPKPKFEEEFGGPRQVYKKLALKGASISLLFPTPGFRHPDRHALAVLARLLEDRDASPLLREGSETRKQALGLTTRFDSLEDRGLLGIAAVPHSPATAPDTGIAILAALQKVRLEGVPESDVRRVVKQMRLEAAVRRGALGPLLQDLAEATLFGDVRYGWNLETDLAKVTAADLKRVAETYLVPANARTLILFPKGEPELSAVAADQLEQAVTALISPEEIPPKPDFASVLYSPGKGPSAATRTTRRPAPKATRFLLPNGLPVVVKPDQGRGLVAASLQIRAGATFDPDGKEGLAQVVASSLWIESKGISREEFRRRRAALGTALTVAAGRETVEAGVTVFPEDLGEALALLAGPVIDSVFHPENLNAAMERVRSREGIRSGSPLDQATDLLREKLYRGHPYGRSGAGTEASLTSIAPEDLIAFHRHAYRPDRAVLALVGDLDEAQARRLAGAAFGGWIAPATQTPLPEIEEGAVEEAEAGEFSRLLDVYPSAVLLGFPGVPLRHPDFPLVRALGTVLSARGFLDLVLDRPVALSVSAVPEGLSRGGILFVEATAPAQEAGKVAYEMMLRARALAVKEVTPSTIRDVISIEQGRLLREREGLYAVASNLAFHDLLGAGYAAYDVAPPVPPDLTPAALKEAAARYLNSEKMVRVTVGPLSR